MGKTGWRAWAGALAAGLTLAVGSARADAVTDWERVLDEATKDLSSPAGAASPLDRVDARMALAMFEAADAVDRRYASYLSLPPAPEGASEEAAIAAAAHDVLAASLPPEKAAQADAAYASALAKMPDGEARRAGVAAGQAAAKAAMAAGGLDPARPPQFYRPFAEPGVWVPTALPVFSPYTLSYRPWFLPKPEAARPPPPPALTSPVYIKAVQETQALGSKTSTLRTAEQTRDATFWIADDLDALMRQVADRPGRSLVQNARFYALVRMAMDDAGTAIVDAKMHYGFWRPITAIRNGDRDPSPETVRDESWTPLLTTPNHPEYPCGHCIFAATVAAVLLSEPGVTPDRRFTFTSTSLPGAVKALTLPESVTACSMSRIYGGVHYRFSNDAAEAMGRKVAALALSRFAPPLR